MPKQLKIIQIPEFEKELRTPSRPLTKEEILSNEMQTFFDDLLYTLKTSEEQVGVQGVGISAVQVNKHVQAFYAMNVKTEKIKLYINPKIIILDDTPIVKTEGCLSIPNASGQVQRPKKIKIVYLNRNGNKQESILSGYNARVILHEYDHLLGVLFIDKLVKTGDSNFALA